MQMRTERDILGEMTLPGDTLYGINTARAIDNFQLKGKTVNPLLIKGMLTVKKAAALTYAQIGVRPDIYRAAAAACDELLSGAFAGAFPTQALQGGAGTSANMNVNEVIANLALIHSGHHPGEYDVIHPLDDINRGQSTNDVYPTALRIAAIWQLRELSDACASLQQALQQRENEFDSIHKLGRTELMDAVPIRLGEEFGAYAQAIARDRWRLYKVEERLRQVNIGGTAVGLTGKQGRQYRFGIIEKLRELTGIGLAAAEYPMDVTQNQDIFVEVSGLLKALAVNLMKIAGDLRLMNMGPGGGLSEIRLRPVQQGSTVMPGKVNPVIPEMVMQCAIRVIANDTAVTMAAGHGEFELNAFLPLIADALLESLQLLTGAVHTFREKCILTLSADEENCRRHLDESYAFAAEYLPALGYDTVAAVVHDHSPGDARLLLQAMVKAKENK